MTLYHQLLESGRWFKFSLLEQMSNIGSDVERAIRWKKAGNIEYMQDALDRALTLIDLTIADPKNRKRLKEVVRLRELFIDYLLYDNTYNFTEEYWQNYFYFFSYAAIAEREQKLAESLSRAALRSSQKTHHAVT